MLNDFLAEFAPLLIQGTIDTLVMVFASTAVAYVIGTVLGVVLHLTAPNGLRPVPVLNAVLGWVANIGRSLPFIILLIALMPATQALVGTSTGVVGVLPPLVVATAPFVARMVEQSLAEVSRDAVEAAEACGAVANIGRSLPFIILLIALMPATQALVGTSTGVVGVLPPLVVATAPFVARMVEQSLAEVSRDAVEAAEACGASVPRIVFSALLPEALPSIVRGIAVTLCPRRCRVSCAASP